MQGLPVDLPYWRSGYPFPVPGDWNQQRLEEKLRSLPQQWKQTGYMELVEQTPNFFVLVRRNSPNRWVNLFSRSNYVARCRGFWKEDRLQLSLKGPGWSGPYFWLHSAGFLGGIHLALARQQWVTGTIVFGIAMALLLCSVKIFPPIRKSFHRDVLEFLKS